MRLESVRRVSEVNEFFGRVKVTFVELFELGRFENLLKGEIKKRLKVL